ncbi:MAG: hypothetical protein OXB88_01715 [Bacteriovoracales bacterium]|nr:hypothetical protein [Bacteriovoracales bacterium]
MRLRILFFSLSFCLFASHITSNAFAKMFANEFIEFELPPNWDCHLDGGDWVCQSNHEDRKKEAIIIMSAKDRGSEDSLEHYKKHLKKGRSYQVAEGKTYVSRPKYVRSRRIGEYLWIDALQLAGEVPGYYTRYMATVKGEVGTAVTFTVIKNKYDDYKDIFDKIISSIRFFEGKGKALSLNQSKREQDLLSFGNLFKRGESSQSQKNPLDDAVPFFFIFAFLIPVIMGFFLYQKNKKELLAEKESQALEGQNESQHKEDHLKNGEIKEKEIENDDNVTLITSTKIFGKNDIPDDSDR